MTPAAPAALAVAPTPSSCPLGFLPLELVPETVQEAALVGMTTACGDLAGRTTWLQNSSDAVWVIDAPRDVVRTDPGQVSPRVELFRRLSANLVPGITVEPNTSIYVSLARGQQLHMTLDAPTQAMWHTGEVVGRKLLTSGRDAVIKATTGRSPTSFALATCIAQGYDFGNRLTGPDSADGYSLQEYLGLGRSVQKCGSAIRLAEQDAARTGAAPAATLQDATDVVASPRFATQVRSTFSACLSRVGALLRRV